VVICQKVAHSLDEIIAKARQVDNLVGEIASASVEQTEGIAQVNTAVSQMDSVTQSNAAVAEESAAASQELSAQAVVLQDSVEQLLSLVEGGGGNPPPARVYAAPSRDGRGSGNKKNGGSGKTKTLPRLANAGTAPDEDHF
jgi:hypothetical protein